MKYGLIGEKLGHSFSKEVHAALADYEYELLEIPADDLASFMLKREFKGINVTIPYKESVIPFLDEISDEAREIGAVNTVVNRDGRLYGYNTDFFGMRALFLTLGVTAKARKVAILGSGGTAKTARAVFKSLEASSVITVSRSKKGSLIDYAELYRDHTDTDIIINTTPVGMYPDNGSSPIDLGCFKNLSGVLDVIYNPLRTRLVLDARSRGIPSIGGLYMLVAQAVYASEIFLDTKYPDTKIDEIYSRLLSEKENIALIGMPSSGKSTVGKVLANMLERKLVETDEIIVKKVGKSISNMFNDDGESAFRDAESAIIANVSMQNALVISTGGGSILRDINVDNLRQNSKLIFIDRSLKNLIATDDRPLSRSPEAVKNLYNTRYKKYVCAADITVDGDLTPNEIAEKIIGGLKL